MLQIYLTDLAAYNKGFLIGEWIKLPMPKHKLQDAITKVLRSGEALCAIEYGYELHEEYFITDYEWEDIPIKPVNEYEALFELNTELQVLQPLNNYTHKAINFLIREGLATSIGSAILKADDVVIYENATMTDVAYEVIQEYHSNLPPIILNNLDYDHLGRELLYDGIYYELDGDVYEYTG
jgi:hypothetical protein